MKNLRYHTSLYVIVPIIFAGHATLSSMLTLYCLREINIPVFWLIVLIVMFGAFCGLAVVWIIPKQLKDFIRDPKNGQIHIGGNVFKPIVDILSIENARRMFPNVIAETEVMRGVLGRVSRVAPTDSTVLVLGENGTGKELIATCIHEHSKRKDGPFIKINCGAIPDDLLEDELFGHQRWGFIGVDASKKGKFELADHGTIFLDEIGDMPLSTQAKMLRVLQERELVRLGGEKTIKVDVRIIAATNKDLERMVKEGTFREDLFFRLSVVNIALLPLRERRDDIPDLVDYFCIKRNVTITSLAKQMLRNNHDWPGNIKELESTVERAIALCENDVIEPQHLPDKIVGDEVVMPVIAKAASGESEEGAKEDNLSIDERLEEIEQAMIIDALKKANGVQFEAAKLLKIKERSLWHRIKKFQIDVKQFKEKNK